MDDEDSRRQFLRNIAVAALAATVPQMISTSNAAEPTNSKQTPAPKMKASSNGPWPPVIQTEPPFKGPPEVTDTTQKIASAKSVSDLGELEDKFQGARKIIQERLGAKEIDNYIYLHRIDYKQILKEPSGSASKEFRYQHVEQLLAQTAALLERGIAGRAEWETLAEKNFATLMELKEFCELDDIHRKETAAGYYSFPYTQSEAESYSMEQIKEINKLINLMLNAMISDNNGPDYTEPFQRLLTFTKGEGLDQLKEAQEILNHYIKDPKVEPMQDRITERSFLLEYENYWERYITSCAQQSVSQKKVSALAAKSNYDWNNIEFRKQRMESARRMNAWRAVAYTEQGSALNYQERMEVILNRFTEDFNDAQNRITALREGLQKIYGQPFPDFNSLKNAPTGDTNGPFPHDKVLLAVREAMEWLVKFSINEQNYILPISVKAQLPTDWEAGLNGNKSGGAWDFIIGTDLFPAQAHVRLRGLSMTVKTDVPGIFQAVVQVPQKGYVRFLDNPNPASLDQCNVPQVRFGRVQQLDSVRGPDIVGALALHNVSPISLDRNNPWRVTLSGDGSPPVIGTKPRDNTVNELKAQAQVEDVLLHLILAIRSDNPPCP